MPGFAYYVLGEPKAQGSKRFVGFARASGRPIMTEQVDIRPWRDRVTLAAPAIPRPLDGPIMAWMVFTVRRPSATPKRVTAPSTKPDVSKLCRCVEDSITDAGLWADDARVAGYVRLEKVWWGYDDNALPAPGVIVAAVERVGAWHDDLLRMAAETRAEAVSRIRGENEATLWAG